MKRMVVAVAHGTEVTRSEHTRRRRPSLTVFLQPALRRARGESGEPSAHEEIAKALTAKPRSVLRWSQGVWRASP